MRRSCLCLTLAAGFLWAATAAAQSLPSVVAVSGLVDKTDKDSLTIRPRGADGKFGKSVVVRVTGTSKLTTVRQQKRGGKVILLQRETDLKDLQKNQVIAVIYAAEAGGAVLLVGVVQPAK